MCEDARAIDRRIRDVIDEHPARRIQICEITHAFGDLMVRARRVAADPQSADNLAARIVEWHAAAEENQPGSDLILAAPVSTRWRDETRIPQIGLTETPERMPRLRKGI